MIIDMHSHSVFSDDSRATVEQYAKWVNKVVRKKGRLDAIVLTEHRGFNNDSDYSDIEEQYDIRFFKATELDTNRGHVLIYGVNDHLLNKFDFTDVDMNAEDLVREAFASGAFAVPAHPGRKRGLRDRIESGLSLPGIRIVEILNGGSSHDENRRAQEFAESNGYGGIGGSDAHFVNAIGKYATDFDSDDINSIEDLVRELKAGAFKAVKQEELSPVG